MPHLVVGTAGHIDHGKTALVKAITGIDADRLKEEKERGITIDLGFANLRLPGGDTIAFIDVPGHERFIKNMLAGVGGIDAVILVIAADESIKPQTREHLDICSLLRIPHGFTVLTKVDRMSADAVDLVELEVREFLKGSFLEEASVVRVSSTTGLGLPQLVQLLQGLVDRVHCRDAAAPFRLPIDRSFTMKGFGTVVTGTLVEGKIRNGDEVEILPAKRRSRIRGIQVHGMAADEVRAGQRTALNLHGVEVSEIERGMVLSAPDAFKPTSMLDCHLQLLPTAPAAIEMRKRIRFHTGTVELMGYVVVLGRERLVPGESGFAQIRLESPAVVASGDRFIIRQYSPMSTIGGGEVLDAAPRKHRRMDVQVIERLEILKGSPLADREKLFEKVVTLPVQPPVEIVDVAMRNAVESRFRTLGLKVPRPDEIIEAIPLERAKGRKLIRLLLNEKVLVKITDDLVLHHETADKLIHDVKALKSRNGKLGVGEFKELTGASRKYAIPLLEFLDRQRVTRRTGDERTIV